MSKNFRQKISETPHKGGIVGALLGALLSIGFHKPEEKPIRTAGRTAAFGGAGYLLGELAEKWFRKGNR
jgi:hypothetical protein